MAVKKKTVHYRVDGRACQQGYINIGDCDDNNVYDKDGAVVPGAVVTPAGDCPQEVVVVNSPEELGGRFESDPVEMCDAGTEFLRWIVKDNGEPTGERFDTDLAGAAYVVTDEAGVTVGKCEASCAKAPLGVLTSWAV